MTKISRIKKRNGQIVNFDQGKITDAILKALASLNYKDVKIARILSTETVKLVNNRFEHRIPSVEDIQDIVEEVLVKSGYADVAKAYILYRQKRTEIRESKKFIGIVDDLKLGVNAIKILKRRYLLKNEEGKVIETPSEMFRRVSKAIAKADLPYKGEEEVRETEEEFYQAMTNRDFVSNSPTLMNAGTKLGQLSACFVLPVDDSMEGIFTTLKHMAMIHQSGGGTGFSFSKVRPAGDIVGSTKGIASGPVSFMEVYDAATNVIKQGGRRRGANMAILHVTHPDILKFIEAKSSEDKLTNFNLSVAITEKFMKAVKDDDEYYLVNPRTGKATGKLHAGHVFDLIASNAWRTGDPGILFIDEINRYNPTPAMGEIHSTNPCGEQPLLAYESCNLGSVNLARFVNDGDIDWKRLKSVTRTAIHFLDNVIDVNKYPTSKIARITRANRKVGLGVMGFADMLIEMNIPYDSKEALTTGEKVLKFISEEATKKSVEISVERGSFPNFKGSLWEERGYRGIRNSTVTTIAPTGTISAIAGCSSGIEPIFAVAFVRDVMEGTRLLEIQQSFEKVAKKKGFYSMDLMRKIAETGSVQEVEEIPRELRRVFVTALDIDPEWHVRMQAALQKYVDNAVSKTVNLPPTATVDDVKKIFLLAYKLKCKGVTVYRYGSRKQQVLYIGPLLTKEMRIDKYVAVNSEYSGGCPKGECPF